MFENQQQVINTLLELDFDLDEKNLKEKVHFCIFGGTAFLFFSQRFRATSDIDVLFLNKVMNNDVIKIFNEYDINNQMQGIVGVPEDYMNRAYELSGFKNLKVFVAHPIDLVISKLIRGDMRDATDV
ncbi:hypothetical protein BEP19_00520 [Ammoniphilus oxalaticus]|uniref:DUF6036 domain-containing protein n=1 Tax=Ammoniphilus oxalaticus TaxID=66863 RepID=A0A419SRE6_9BACL|nr:DUF6036 family nucleotidyltransferase [Ammoniphilus oxalaticus]RKD27090.1 hypothetical protein BEP19_00520 [Ammoniphilus oxalaticus]